MKKRVMNAIIMAIVTITIIGMCGFVFWSVANDGTTPPDLPIKSVRNRLLITSNGCCFWVEDVRVILQCGNYELEISYIQELGENDIFEYEIPDFEDAPIELIVRFRSYYGYECGFDITVMEFENISSLKKAGLLLYFQESDGMYFNVISGKKHITYKLGGGDEDWLIMDVPNKIYS
jgi:hypothetical protein